MFATILFRNFTADLGRFFCFVVLNGNGHFFRGWTILLNGLGQIFTQSQATFLCRTHQRRCACIILCSCMWGGQMIPCFAFFLPLSLIHSIQIHQTLDWHMDRLTWNTSLWTRTRQTDTHTREPYEHDQCESIFGWDYRESTPPSISLHSLFFANIKAKQFFLLLYVLFCRSN